LVNFSCCNYFIFTTFYNQEIINGSNVIIPFSFFFLHLPVIPVMSVGFSEAESRLGLRACGGDIQTAVAHIMKRKEVRLSIFHTLPAETVNTPVSTGSLSCR